MNVVVAGLSPRDEAAFGFFMSRSMKGWSWKSTPGGREAVLPKADLLVADLVSLGLAQWNEAAEAELLRRLDGTPAVLLVPSHDRTWAAMDGDALKRHSLVWLARPYGAEAMRVALEKAVAPARAAAPVAPRAMDMPPGGARPVVSVSAPVAARPPGVSGMADDVPQLSAAGLQARLAVLPQDGRHVFLRQLSAMLAQEMPFEARFTVQNSVIFHPADGWVASNTPLMVIERVCQSDALASAVTVREIEGSQAEERAQRLGMPLRELEAFLWVLTAAALDRHPPRHGA
jgi:hypothetical protein